MVNNNWPSPIVDLCLLNDMGMHILPSDFTCTKASLAVGSDNRVLL